MALDRGRFSGRDRRGRADAKEERRPFPVWTLLVILGCAAVWVAGAKLYERQMAAYDSYAAIRQAVSGDTFFPGVTLDGTPLGGMTLEEAQALVNDRKAQTAEAFSLVVAYGDRRWRITSQEVPMTFDAQTMLERAYAVGRTGSLEERYAQVQRVAAEGAHFQTGFSYDRDAIDRLVGVIGDSIDVEAKDAQVKAFDVNNRTFAFSDEEPGYRVNREKLAEDILAALDAHAYDRVIEPEVETLAPKVARAQLEGTFGLVASFTTQTTKDADRNNNIALSANALNGRVVLPGETMSFNESTGQRTGAKGYREAGAIAGGILVDDTGGGVCQTSSTLFNAVVRADLTIVKRTAHSWPSSYVEKGEDATVNWPSLDFVFKNDGPYPVFVVAWYADQAVTIEIYGQMLKDGMTIDLESTVTKTIRPSNDILYTLDPSLPVGTRQSGRSKRTGYEVETYKVYKDSAGKEIERKKLWTTTYRATQKEILYNDGSAAAANGE